MLKSCRWCGRIHDTAYQCPEKPAEKKARKEPTQADKFRNTKAWQRKREEIKQRDKYMCQICVRKLYNTIGRACNFEDIQVHHIVPLQTDFKYRLDNRYLISLCPYHHKMAENGEIPQEALRQIADEQNIIPPCSFAF